MKYYRRGKTRLNDEASQSMFDALEEELLKLPPEKQPEAARKAFGSITKELPKILEEMTQDAISSSRKDVKKAIKEDEKRRLGFEKRLRKSHKDLIDKYIEVVGECVEAVEHHRQLTHETLGEKDTVLPVILRLHARVCRIANEILALVRSGYGTGALARWRAMHELVVVMAYLRNEGPRAIKVFQDHGAISGYKAMKDYQAYCGRLGQKPYSSYELRLARESYNRRLRKYGPNFKTDYGWTHYLSGGAISNFRDLEKHVGVDHLRPYYRLASLGIHSEWRSFITGEEFEALDVHDVVLVGPADYGFDDAVSLSLLTVTHATVLILTYNIAMTSILYARVIQEAERSAQEMLEKYIG